MKAAAFLACVGSAAAFQMRTSMKSVSKTSLQMTSLDDIVGTSVEVGGKPWDPMGFSRMAAQTEGMNTSPDLKWLQEAEIKHGRICMLAFVGVVATKAGIHLPGYPETTDWTAAFGLALKNNPLGMAQIFAAIGIVEGHYFPGDFWTGGGDRTVGDLGYDPLGFQKNKSDADKKTMQLKEIKNGRLAMIAMAAFASEHLIHGSVPLISGAF